MWDLRQVHHRSQLPHTMRQQYRLFLLIAWIFPGYWRRGTPGRRFYETGVSCGRTRRNISTLPPLGQNPFRKGFRHFPKFFIGNGGNGGGNGNQVHGAWLYDFFSFFPNRFLSRSRRFFELVRAFLEQIQKMGLVLGSGEYFLAVDTAIHSVVISTFKS